ncbi:hypothetical protein CDL12_05532 [Handroanthus impetiginosus]|uniref:F-box domain-containing protein n=1 Tax=Handroanthus impetiginosus TaxID=429701 RepID=A0A2G9HW77_9LAMI|nr:hypothetical protein CDL12_05532 [Handroanthus impetiginosus]
MDSFTKLPEESVSEILSRTSPIDASRFAVISKGFNSAANSDTVWGRFLPSDYSQIISRSVYPVLYAAKKELYLSLCHSPILVDGGKLSFSLEKRSGKKCYMVGARELVISWGDAPVYWEWISYADSRFSEVAQLRFVCWLDIRGKIKTQMLSPHATYGAYLVFKLAERCHGLQSADAVVRFVDVEADNDAEKRAGVVHLQQDNGSPRQSGQLPVRRSDGWLEIELGKFCNGRGDNGDAEARLMEIEVLSGKSGLIVEGIEFRPKAQFNSLEKL